MGPRRHADSACEARLDALAGERQAIAQIERQVDDERKIVEAQTAGLGALPALDDDVVAERRVGCREVHDRALVGRELAGERDLAALRHCGSLAADDEVEVRPVERAEFLRLPR